MDRHLGFDLEETKCVLTDIAAFHAVPVAFKLHQPHIFEMKVKKYTSRSGEFMKAPENLMPPVFLKIIQDIEECEFNTKRIMNQCQEGRIPKTVYSFPCLEPFATILHNNLWINNMMQKKDKGNIVRNKIIDFQKYRYGNPLIDVIYFLFSSVQRNVVTQHLDNLIIFYEECFFAVLENLKCDTSSFQRNFLEQADEGGPHELCHLLFTTPLIYRLKEKEVSTHRGPEIDANLEESFVTEEARNHMRFILIEFEKRGWIRD